MNFVTKNFKIDFEPNANTEATIQLDKVRFTVLTSRIIRLEYSETNSFEDSATQTVWYRKQEVPNFEIVKSDTSLEIITEFLNEF